MTPNPRQSLRDFFPFLADAVAHYEKSAPTVAAFAEDLYVRLNETPDKVVVSELLAASDLCSQGDWEQPNYAANRIYHLLHRLGREVTGQAGF